MADAAFIASTTETKEHSMIAATATQKPITRTQIVHVDRTALAQGDTVAAKVTVKNPQANVARWWSRQAVAGPSHGHRRRLPVPLPGAGLRLHPGDPRRDDELHLQAARRRRPHDRDADVRRRLPAATQPAADRRQRRESMRHDGARAAVAQLVEQGTFNPRVVGSSPTGGTGGQPEAEGREQRCLERSLNQLATRCRRRA